MGLAETITKVGPGILENSEWQRLSPIDAELILS